jgi:hypothetical protein
MFSFESVRAQRSSMSTAQALSALSHLRSQTRELLNSMAVRRFRSRNGICLLTHEINCLKIGHDVNGTDAAAWNADKILWVAKYSQAAIGV